MPRLFVGTLADIEEQKRTEQFLAGLKASAPIKFTTAANLHMTWAFIGDLSQDSVENLKQLLAAEMAQITKTKLPPQLLFQSIECWPDEIDPAHLVLTPAQNPQSVQECAKRIDHLVAAFRSAPETLPFRAHVTLARLKKGAVLSDVSTAALESSLPLTLRLNAIGLFESHSIERQSVYRTVASYQL